jgi:protein TonB
VVDPVSPLPVRRKYVPPKYPRDALLRGLEGKVAVSFTVAPDGGPENISVVAATPRNTFDRAAMNAVRQWQFDPAIVDGQAVAHSMEVEIEFVLDE